MVCSNVCQGICILLCGCLSVGLPVRFDDQKDQYHRRLAKESLGEIVTLVRTYQSIMAIVRRTLSCQAATVGIGVGDTRDDVIPPWRKLPLRRFAPPHLPATPHLRPSFHT